jgi:flavin-dependent thymidylate synthase
MTNKVELIDWYGGDKAIARAAWTSTSTDVEAKSDEQIRDLLVNKLWNNGTGKAHKTPFERGIVEFNITADVASHIHIIKHRHLSVNGESARYKELKEDRYLLPEDWSDIKVSKDVGFDAEYETPDGYDDAIHYAYEGQKWIDALELFTNQGNMLYHQCLKDLTPVLGRKRAKESARYFKTYNSQITLSVMTNMSCFHNFYTLRADDAAQLEIQDIANQMLDCIKGIEGNPFKYTLEAFGFA